MDMHLAAAHEPGLLVESPSRLFFRLLLRVSINITWTPKAKCLGLQRMLKKEESKVVVKRDAEKFIAMGSRIR